MPEPRYQKDDTQCEYLTVESMLKSFLPAKTVKAPTEPRSVPAAIIVALAFTNFLALSKPSFVVKSKLAIFSHFVKIL